MKQLDRNIKFPRLHFTNSASRKIGYFKMLCQHSQFAQLSTPIDDAEVTHSLIRCSLVLGSGSTFGLWQCPAAAMGQQILSVQV